MDLGLEGGSLSRPETDSVDDVLPTRVFEEGVDPQDHFLRSLELIEVTVLWIRKNDRSIETRFSRELRSR
jgi:hypothetical protein